MREKEEVEIVDFLIQVKDCMVGYHSVVQYVGCTFTVSQLTASNCSQDHFFYHFLPTGKCPEALSLCPLPHTASTTGPDQDNCQQTARRLAVMFETILHAVTYYTQSSFLFSLGMRLCPIKILTMAVSHLYITHSWFILIGGR